MFFIQHATFTFCCNDQSLDFSGLYLCQLEKYFPLWQHRPITDSLIFLSPSLAVRGSAVRRTQLCERAYVCVRAAWLLCPGTVSSAQRWSYIKVIIKSEMQYVSPAWLDGRYPMATTEEGCIKRSKRGWRKIGTIRSKSTNPDMPPAIRARSPPSDARVISRKHGGALTIWWTMLN